MTKKSTSPGKRKYCSLFPRPTAAQTSTSAPSAIEKTPEKKTKNKKPDAAEEKKKSPPVAAKSAAHETPSKRVHTFKRATVHALPLESPPKRSRSPTRPPPPPPPAPPAPQASLAEAPARPQALAAAPPVAPAPAVVAAPVSVALRVAELEDHASFDLAKLPAPTSPKKRVRSTFNFLSHSSSQQLINFSQLIQLRFLFPRLPHLGFLLLHPLRPFQ